MPCANLNVLPSFGQPLNLQICPDDQKSHPHFCQLFKGQIPLRQMALARLLLEPQQIGELEQAALADVVSANLII